MYPLFWAFRMADRVQPQRWLIITSSTGSGHDMRAYALRDWAVQEGGECLTVEVYHALESGSRMGRWGVAAYNWIQRHAPWLHNFYWFVAEAFGWLNGKGWGIARKVWKEKLESSRPQLIISMHDSLNRGYLKAARSILGEANVRCVTYCGEWSGGFGFSRNWIDEAAHYLFVRQPEVREWIGQRDYPKDRIEVFTNLLAPRSFAAPLSPAQRARFRAVQLGLHPDRFTVFLATGALGADRHLAFLEALLELRDRIQVIVVSGRNEEAFDRIAAWSRKNPGLRLAQEGFSRQMHVLMQVSDCLLTRGGANTMAEAVYFRCPILFHAHHGLMPQERCTLRFLIDQQIGVRIGRPRHLVSVVRGWLDDPEAHRQLRLRLEAVASTDKPWTLVRRLTEIAAETRPA